MAWIGPIEVELIREMSWGNSANVQDVKVPFGQDFSYKNGAALPTYNIRSEFFANTDREAAVIRHQINGMVASKSDELYFIDFDRDDEELNGWFIIRSINTDYPPRSPGNYPFTLVASKVASQGAFWATYWRNERRTGDYDALADLTRIFPPYTFNSQSNAPALSREGEFGEIIGTTFGTSLLVGQPGMTGAFGMGSLRNMQTFNACRVYFTPDYGRWEPYRVFSPEALNSITTDSEIFITNGLIRIGYIPLDLTNTPTLYFQVFDDRFGVWVGDFIPEVTNANGDNLTSPALIIDSISANEIKFKIIFSELDNNNNPSSITEGTRVKWQCSLKRGRYHLDVRESATFLNNFITITERKLLTSAPIGDIVDPSHGRRITGSSGYSNLPQNYLNGSTTSVPPTGLALNASANITGMLTFPFGCINGFIFTSSPVAGQPPDDFADTGLIYDFVTAGGATEDFAIFMYPNPRTVQDELYYELSLATQSDYTLSGGAEMVSDTDELGNTISYLSLPVGGSITRTNPISLADGNWIMVVYGRHVLPANVEADELSPVLNSTNVSGQNMSPVALVPYWGYRFGYFTISGGAGSSQLDFSLPSSTISGKLAQIKWVRFVRLPAQVSGNNTNWNNPSQTELLELGREYLTNVIQKSLIPDPRYI